MSEQEFENWLALLSGLLKLSPEQRQNISDELRSHLEERMEDLIDAGSSREEAIAAALEEFGDTAALAHHFTSIAHQKRRRLMRYTYGTIAAVTCAILVLAAFWPEPEGPVMQNVAAQSQPKQGVDGAGPGAVEEEAGSEANENRKQDILQIDPKNPFAGNQERIEAKLAEPYAAEFFQMPIREILEDISVNKGIPFYFEPGLLGEIIDPDQPIDLRLDKNAVSLKTLLDLLLLELGISETHGYTIRDNIIVFTEKQKTTEIAVYNCRDLLALQQPQAPMAEMMGGGFGSEMMGDSGGAMMGEMGYGMEGYGGPVLPAPSASNQHLMRVIINTVAPETWIVAGRPVSESGGTGYIDAINGLIVIKHTREVHNEVQELLKLLREAKQEVAAGN